jgi:ribonuclease P protein subunit RPR2
MGKKKKKSAGVILPQRDAMNRINYLYQAALCLSFQSPPNICLARCYINTMKTISKRLVIKLDPSIKRWVCKSCDTPLIPGVSCTGRLRARRQKHVVIKCTTCGTIKRFLTNNNYQLWTDKKENIEII